MNDEQTILNIDRLQDYIGQMISYKQITDILEIKYYRGNSKDRQLKVIEHYYNIEKTGRKYLIIEKYDDPIPLVDNRQGKYYDDLEVIILYALQNTETYNNVWSATEALIVTSLVNSNYRIGKKDIRLTADALEVDIDYLNTFYLSTHKRFKKVFEQALKRMRDKRLIDYKEITMLYKRVVNIQMNEMYIPIIDDNGNIQYKTDRIHIEATQQERQFILKTEKQVLKGMGLSNVSELIRTGKYNAYKQKVNDILKKKLNIEYYYTAYDIVHNKEDIVEAITEVKRFVAEDSLNTIKLDALNNSKDKMLNKDIPSKEVCVDILINKYPIADLKTIIKNYLKNIKEQEKKENELLPF